MPVKIVAMWSVLAPKAAAKNAIVRVRYEMKNRKSRIKHYKKGGSANWIEGAIKKPGALRSQLGIGVGEKIPAKTLAAATKKPGKLGQRARLAETLRGFHKT